jgi:peptidoglycan/xylan/chitin deacetylase (PgdA/CDA1 family)
MSRVLVLMYHALYTDTAEREALDAPDRPYAVSLESFRAQLRFLQEAKIPVLDRQALKRPVTGLPQWSVFMTFDDGHDSNHRLALAALKDHGMRATFFVTSNFIGQRPGFCSAHDLRELAEAGMDVQSHGQTHLFFDDLST